MQAINNPDLDGLPSTELCQYRVCQIHFAKSAYKSTHIRQFLKDDAVPELLLNIGPAASPASTSDGRDFMIIDVPEDNEMDFTLQNSLIDSINTCEEPISTIHLKVLPSWEDRQELEAWIPKHRTTTMKIPFNILCSIYLCHVQKKILPQWKPLRQLLKHIKQEHFLDQ